MMIDPDTISQALFDVTLLANAQVRLSSPPKLAGLSWWRIGSAAWVQALPATSVEVRHPDEDRKSEVRFRADRPGLEGDEDADWVWASDAVMGLAAKLVDGILLQLDASVPALPTRAQSVLPTDLELDWLGAGAGKAALRRLRRQADSAALAAYLDRVAFDDAGDHPSTAETVNVLSRRLVRELSAIPRPADSRVSLARADEKGFSLSWEQTGSPELLWGASQLTWSKASRFVVVSRLPPDVIDQRRRLGAWVHLLAMATAVESATGGLAVPLHLKFRTSGSRLVSTAFTMVPKQWGFDLPRLVQDAREGKVPENITYISEF